MQPFKKFKQRIKQGLGDDRLASMRQYAVCMGDEHVIVITPCSTIGSNHGMKRIPPPTPAYGANATHPAYYQADGAFS